MFETIKKIFGAGPAVNYGALVAEGAQIVDVRSREEFRSGHISGSINIPLQNLQENLAKLKKDKTIITCCASGMRSATAKSILLRNGFTVVHNGGGWMGLQNKIR